MASTSARGQCVVELVLIAFFLILVFVEVMAQMEAAGRSALPHVQLSKPAGRVDATPM